MDEREVTVVEPKKTKAEIKSFIFVSFNPRRRTTRRWNVFQFDSFYWWGIYVSRKQSFCLLLSVLSASKCNKQREIFRGSLMRCYRVGREMMITCSACSDVRKQISKRKMRFDTKTFPFSTRLDTLRGSKGFLEDHIKMKQSIMTFFTWPMRKKGHKMGNCSLDFSLTFADEKNIIKNFLHVFHILIKIFITFYGISFAPHWIESKA